jgi:hypothetical protein
MALGFINLRFDLKGTNRSFPNLLASLYSSFLPYYLPAQARFLDEMSAQIRAASLQICENAINT